MTLECILEPTSKKPKLKILQEHCDDQCDIGYDYHLSNESVCCGECVQSHCVFENGIYEAGDNWKSVDNCTFYECSEKNGLVEITSFKKACPDIPTDCSSENLYVKDCCQYCRVPKKIEVSDALGSPSELILTKADAYRNHPCARDCVAGEGPRSCAYTFVVSFLGDL